MTDHAKVVRAGFEALRRIANEPLRPAPPEDETGERTHAFCGRCYGEDECEASCPRAIAEAALAAFDALGPLEEDEQLANLVGHEVAFGTGKTVKQGGRDILAIVSRHLGLGEAPAEPTTPPRLVVCRDCNLEYLHEINGGMCPSCGSISWRAPRRSGGLPAGERCGTCPQCEGNGIVAPGGQQCHTCRGTGEASK